jgi:hypothetical protein
LVSGFNGGLHLSTGVAHNEFRFGIGLSTLVGNFNYKALICPGRLPAPPQPEVARNGQSVTGEALAVS